MFEAWDMIAGLRDADLGGAPDLLDVIGINFYADNQWVHEGGKLAPGEAGYRPLRDILTENFMRYGRPIIIAEDRRRGRRGGGLATARRP